VHRRSKNLPQRVTVNRRADCPFAGFMVGAGYFSARASASTATGAAGTFRIVVDEPVSGLFFNRQA
jgi:hypothetical protein